MKGNVSIIPKDIRDTVAKYLREYFTKNNIEDKNRRFELFSIMWTPILKYNVFLRQSGQQPGAESVEKFLNKFGGNDEFRKVLNEFVGANQPDKSDQVTFQSLRVESRGETCIKTFPIVELTRETVINFLENIDVNEQTKRNYENGLTKLRAFSQIEPQWYTPSGLIKFKNGLLTAGLDTGTINTYLIPVKRLFKFMFSRGLIPINPAEELKNFKKKKSRRESFSIEQVKKLLQTIQERPVKDEIEERIKVRDYAMTRLIAKTGLREISIVNAKIADLSYKDSHHILWVKVKGKLEKDNFVVLTDGLFDDIWAAIGDRNDGYLFIGYGNRNSGGQLEERSVRRIITDYMVQAGIKTENNCVHSLRNFFANTALKAGAKIEQVQEAMHHQDPKTTMGYANDLERLSRPAELFIRKI